MALILSLMFLNPLRLLIALHSTFLMVLIQQLLQCNGINWQRLPKLLTVQEVYFMMVLQIFQDIGFTEGMISVVSGICLLIFQVLILVNTITLYQVNMSIQINQYSLGSNLII